MDRENNTRKLCCVDKCGRPATRISSQMCEKHYYRKRRNGTTEYIGNAIPGNLEHYHGYVLQAAPGHPVALGSHRVYQHRVAYYDAHGEGPFICHWCGVLVTWKDMHVDHVDSNPQNNNLSNLVSSCARCNQERGHDKMRKTILEKHGITVHGRTLTLTQWAKELGVARSALQFRIKAGWPIDRVFSHPKGATGPKRKQ